MLCLCRRLPSLRAPLQRTTSFFSNAPKQLEDHISTPSTLLSLKQPLPGFVEEVPRIDPVSFAVETSTLANGIRIISRNTLSPYGCVGLLSKGGSKFETLASEHGFSTLLSKLPLKSSQRVKFPETMQELEGIGCSVFSYSTRSNVYSSIDFPRNSVDRAAESLLDSMAYPALDAAEINTERETYGSFYKAVYAINPPSWLHDHIFEAAYGADSPMGHPNCPEPDRFSSIDLRDFQSFHKKITNPSDLVVSGVGVDHQNLVSIAESVLGGLENNVESSSFLGSAPLSAYRGGLKVVEDTSDETRVRMGLPPKEDYRSNGYTMIAWESPKIQDRRAFLASLIIQSVLGAGNSFSAGGPGKGMFSYLSTNAVDLYRFLHHASAAVLSSDDSSLFTITTIVNDPEYLSSAVIVSFNSLVNMSKISQNDLVRGRNHLRSMLATVLEQRNIAVEDMATQLMRSDSSLDFGQVSQIVESISLEEVQELALSIVQSRPSVVICGPQNSISPAAQKFRDLDSIFQN